MIASPMCAYPDVKTPPPNMYWPGSRSASCIPHFHMSYNHMMIPYEPDFLVPEMQHEKLLLTGAHQPLPLLVLLLEFEKEAEKV